MAERRNTAFTEPGSDEDEVEVKQQMDFEDQMRATSMSFFKTARRSLA